MNLEIGDMSESLSEKYILEVGSVCLRMTEFGGSTNRVVPFRIGREYGVRVKHIGSITYPPDLDYVIDVSPPLASNGPTVGVVKHDPAGLLNGGSNLAASFFTNEAAIVVFKMNMTAYRPRTEGPGTNNPFARHAVPEDLEETPGAGIRVNGDDDNGNRSADRNDASVTGENDTIEVVLQAAPFSATGLVYALKRSDSNSSIKVWTTQNKGQALLGSNHETNLTFTSTSKTVWVECPTGGVADLEFEARTTNGTVICEDKVHFYAFSSIIIAFGGRTQAPNDLPDANEGLFFAALDLYTNGFDVHMYDENSLATDGSGIPYIETSNAVAKRGVSNVGIFGYSYGGDATHDLARRLDENRVDIGTFTIAYSAYVDAIARPFWASQTERPQGSLFHANYYQARNTPHSGPTDPPGANLQVNVQTNWDPLVTHAHDLSDPPPDHSIDNSANVLSGLKSIFMLMSSNRRKQ